MFSMLWSDTRPLYNEEPTITGSSVGSQNSSTGVSSHDKMMMCQIGICGLNQLYKGSNKFDHQIQTCSIRHTKPPNIWQKISQIFLSIHHYTYELNLYIPDLYFKTRLLYTTYIYIIRHQILWICTRFLFIMLVHYSRWNIPYRSEGSELPTRVCYKGKLGGGANEEEVIIAMFFLLSLNIVNKTIP
jgi:hypothetical protein